MKNSFIVFLLLTLGSSAYGRDVSNYNLLNGVGLNSFDPVNVHVSGSTAKSDATYSVEYQDVVYNFMTAENATEFANKTKLYEPSYGGWCAYAMAFGQKIEIDPNQFIVQNGRTHYFVNQRAKRNFAKDSAAYETKADAEWKKISGESQ